MPDNISENEKRRIQCEVWLSQRKMSKKELAQILEVGESSVYGWFSNTKIPEKRWIQIKKLLCNESEAPEPGCIAVNLSMSPEQWEELTKDMPEGSDKQKLLLDRMIAFTRAARLPKSPE